MNLEQIFIDSTALKGNIFEDPHRRRITVYLPPQYDSDPAQDFATVYWLPAHGKNDQSFLNWKPWEASPIEKLHAWIQKGSVPPAIVVIPDMWTRLGSSQYLNSAMGRYEDFLIDEIIPHIDAHYRTLGAGHRAIIGHSSGGYGAIVQAMRHPDMFSAVACHSADIYWEYTCLPMIAKLHQGLKKYGGAAEFLQNIPQIDPKGGTFWATAMTLCWSIAHGTNPKAPLGFDLPINSLGQLDEKIWQKWLSFDPLRMVDQFYENLRQMKAIYITAGAGDEYQLQVGARLFSQKLHSANVNHIHEEHLGGHSSSAVPYQRSFALMIKVFQA